MERHYQKSHPWLEFVLKLGKFPYRFWLDLGECVGKCDHLQRTAMSGALREDLYRLYLSKGAAATTAIEGNTLGEEQVQKIVQGVSLPVQESYRQQKMQAENVIAVYNEIVEQARNDFLPPLFPQRLHQFQKRILQGLDVEGNVGRARRRGVQVANYRGAPPEDCPHLLQRLCGWLANDSGFAELTKTAGKKGTAIIRAALVHLYIAWIHPYDDGNGRTARMAEFYCLVAGGIPAAAAHLTSNHCNVLREEYYAQLRQASEKRSPIDFIAFIVRGLRDGLREQLEYVYKEHERLVWKDYLQSAVAGNIAARRRRIRLANWLRTQEQEVGLQEMLKVSDIALLYATSKSAAALLNTDLNALAKINIVVKGGHGYSANTKLLQDRPPDAQEKFKSSVYNDG